MHFSSSVNLEEEKAFKTLIRERGSSRQPRLSQSAAVRHEGYSAGSSALGKRWTRVFPDTGNGAQSHAYALSGRELAPAHLATL